AGSTGLRLRSMSKTIEVFRHDEAPRKNIPTAEHQAVLPEEAQHPVRIAYERRNRDLDPQLVWRGKDETRTEAISAEPAPSRRWRTRPSHRLVPPPARRAGLAARPGRRARP